MNQRCKKHGAVLNWHIAKVRANFNKLLSSIRNHQSFMQLLSMENSCVGQCGRRRSHAFEDIPKSVQLSSLPYIALNVRIPRSRGWADKVREPMTNLFRLWRMTCGWKTMQIQGWQTIHISAKVRETWKVDTSSIIHWLCRPKW